MQFRVIPNGDSPLIETPDRSHLLQFSGVNSLAVAADACRDLNAAPAMRDALALALERVEMNNYGGEEDAAIAEIKAALALAGGDTVAGTSAGPDWRAIAASLLPYAESRAEDMDENACETAGQGLDSAPYDRELADEAIAAVDDAKAALAGDTVAAMRAPQDGGEVAADIAGALQIVIDLARGNLADEHDMPEEHARHLDAINQVEDMAVNQFGDA